MSVCGGVENGRTTDLENDQSCRLQLSRQMDHRVRGVG